MLREVAHLLRSPLGSIVLLAETMRTSASDPLTDGQRHKLQIIHRAALAAAQTMGDLLTLVGEDEIATHSSGFSVAETLESVEALLRPVAEARECGIEVRARLEGARGGPAMALSRLLLGLGLLATLRTRSGTVEISAEAGRGDTVTFTVLARGARDAAYEEPVEMLRELRTQRETGDRTVSPDGLRMAAARALATRLGTEVRIVEDSGDALHLTFQLTLPPAG